MLRRVLPFARALFAARCSSTAQLQPSVAEPPFAHTVRMRVRPALAGRACMQQQQQPICIWLCFSELEQAHLFVSKVMAYKRYHVATILLTHIKTFAELMEREEQRDQSAIKASGPSLHEVEETQSSEMQGAAH